VGLSSSRPAAAIDQPAPEPNPVVEWNRTLLGILRTPGAQPATIHSTRNFALLHVAIYDAVNAINHEFAEYRVHLATVPEPASPVAAADQAAHDVLVSLYPKFQASLDGELLADLAPIPDSTEKANGVLVGHAVALEILTIRASDGSGAPQPSLVFGDQPGQYQLTPPNFAPADFTQWPAVTPFALLRADQFRPQPPPVLTSEVYTRDFNQVKSLGNIASPTRTAEQTVVGNFWNGNIQDFWNEIAQTAALGHGLNLEQSARLFALLNISLADTAIAFFDAKYFYQLWRPVTAIRRAGEDDNPRTEPDWNWLPLPTKTAPDPSYPGAHSAISAAAAEVLRFFFGDGFTFGVTSESLRGVERHFATFSAAAEEAGLSRIYSGQHFHFDHTSGRRLGREVARWADESVLLPR
jgi:hypothetical protein